MLNRGMALITVLWVVLIVSLVSFTLAAAVRTEMVSAVNSFDSDRALSMAQGAATTVYYGMTRKVDITRDKSPIRLEAGEYVFPFETGEARVYFESNAGRIDLNASSDKLLASVFDSVGVDHQKRNELVDSILDWRDADDIPHLYGAEVNDYHNTGDQKEQTLPRNGPFQTVDELLIVKNMTPELFFGAVIVETATGTYRRVPGLRELLTVSSGSDKVDVNEASFEVLMALPQMDAFLAGQILQERTQKKFQSRDDLVKRIQGMEGHDALQYLSYNAAVPTTIVSKAAIFNSGSSRTVRLLFSRDQRLQIFSLVPLVTRKIDEVRFGRWQY